MGFPEERDNEEGDKDQPEANKEKAGDAEEDQALQPFALFLQFGGDDVQAGAHEPGGGGEGGANGIHQPDGWLAI